MVHRVCHHSLYSLTNDRYIFCLGDSNGGLIGLSKDALISHIHGCRRATDGQFYMFAVQHSNNISLEYGSGVNNDDACLFLPRFLIVYRRRKE